MIYEKKKEDGFCHPLYISILLPSYLFTQHEQVLVLIS